MKNMKLIMENFNKTVKNAQKALADVQRELIASETHPFFWSGYFVIE